MFEPLKAIDVLNEHAVEYVVVGGWGTLQHGASRLIQDVGLLNVHSVGSCSCSPDGGAS